MEKHFLNDDNFISYRKTPWDERSFGFPTSEVVEIKADSEENARKLILFMEEFNRENRIELSYLRIDATHTLLKRILIEQGFYQAEVSLTIEKKRLQQYEFKLPRVELIRLNKDDNDTIEELRIIARDSFDFSRFHEDVTIPEELARARYYNWILDLIHQDKEIYYVKVKGEVVGFHIQELVAGNHANLILTGAKKGKSELSLPIWHTAFLDLKLRGVESVSTLISANNAGVLNLYIYFQFKVRSSLIGMHKSYKKDSVGK